MGVHGGFLDGDSPHDLGCDWYCDGCGTIMNHQPGFSVAGGTWTCTACGYLNDVTSGNIKHYGERPVTEAQLRYIGQIEELLGISFFGSTLEEASDFIDANKGLYEAKLHTPHKYR